MLDPSVLDAVLMDDDEVDEDENEEDAVARPCMSLESMRQLYEMRMNNVLCDAVLSLDDKSRFNVHRNILSACSSFFRYA